MLVATKLTRSFLFEHKGEDVKLPDPSDKLSPEAVLSFYSNTYPILTTAKIEGPEFKDDEMQYQFVTTIGTKG